jgi:hypothetical protein
VLSPIIRLAAVMFSSSDPEISMPQVLPQVASPRPMVFPLVTMRVVVAVPLFSVP